MHCVHITYRRVMYSGAVENHVHPKLKVASVSIASNAGLTAVELAIAMMTGSLSVLADAFHSGVDLTGSVVAIAGIRMALQAADHRYTYGYGRFENASALIQFVLIAIIGVVVLEEATRRFLYGYTVGINGLSLVIILATLIFDAILYRYIGGRGEQLKSSALQADSFHFATDAVGKIGVLVGVGLAYLGYPFMDLVGAAVVGATFLAAAFIMGRRHLEILADAAPDAALMQRLLSAALAVPGVTEVHSLRGRVSGPKVLVDLVIHVPEGRSLEQAHGTAHQVEAALKRQAPEVVEVVIHVEPVHPDAGLEASHAA